MKKIVLENLLEFRTSGEIVKMGNDSEFMKKHKDKINIKKLEQELDKLNIEYRISNKNDNYNLLFYNETYIPNEELFDLLFNNKLISYIEFKYLNLSGLNVTNFESNEYTEIEIIKNLNIENSSIDEIDVNIGGILFAKGSEYANYIKSDTLEIDSNYMYGIISKISEREFNKLLQKYNYYNKIKNQPASQVMRNILRSEKLSNKIKVN